MVIEIWSDIACPFCYIGKKRFENALKNLGELNANVQYKSFLLNPTQKTDTSLSMADYLVQIKGLPKEQVMGMFEHIAQMGAASGINFSFDKAIPANTEKSHLLLQLAAEKGKQVEVKSALFKAFFEEGQNVDDESVLIAIGKSFGISETEISEAFKSTFIRKKLEGDLKEAEEFGISGVPFFVFNRKYAVSGAQSEEVFRQVLQKVAEEETSEHSLNIIEGEQCDTDGNCK